MCDRSRKKDEVEKKIGEERVRVVPQKNDKRLALSKCSGEKELWVGVCIKNTNRGRI